MAIKIMMVSLMICVCSWGGFSCQSKKGTDETSVAARVNGVVITNAEVDKALNNVSLQFGGKIAPEQVKQLREAFRPQVLDNLVSRNLLLQEAERRGLKPGSEEVDAKVAQFKSHTTPEKFKKNLADAGVTEEEFKREVEEGVKIENLLKKQTDKIKEVSGEEVETYYRNNSEKFSVPEQVKASHILIAVSQEDTPEKKEEKRKKLALIRERIEKGEDFATLAREHSACPSKSNGGDLGDFGRGRMAKPFEDAAFGMKAGDLSEIVETKFGYHLIKLTGRNDAKVLTLEESRERLADFLNNQKKHKAVSDYMDVLKKSAKIEYTEPPVPAIPAGQQ